MSYFTKYIYVDGVACKIGDCFEIELGSIGKIIETTSSSYRFKIVGLTGYFKGKEGYFNIISQKKVNLFLCTDHITEGNIIIDGNGDWGIVKNCSDPHNIEIQYAEDGLGLICTVPDCQDRTPDDNIFKIIGIISPDATWVNEGMVIEETDWQWKEITKYEK